MEKKMRNYAVIFSAVLIIFGLALVNLFLPDEDVSTAERRELAQLPEISSQSIFTGKFMAGVEDYALDQFPLRDGFRTLKAFYSTYVMGQKDNNGLYVQDGYIAKMEYPLKEDSIDYAAKVFQRLYQRYMANTDCNVYLSIVPDKNAYLAQESGRLAMDYTALTDSLRQQLPEMEYIDLFPLLSYEDYYRTDTHWKQERLTDVAQKLAEEMGTTLIGDYTEHRSEYPFYGVYTGQLGLPVKADELFWLNSENLEGCTVSSYDDYGRLIQIPMYDESLLGSADAYEMYLGGPVPLVIVENPNATSQKELVIFRDSFGSSIAPLLAEGYSKITLVDIRYLLSMNVGAFVQFEGQDVLFLYSTLVLNNSETMK